jgi:hypothetical protein
MSGRRKFSELEEGMSPERRVRIGRLAEKLEREVNVAEVRGGVSTGGAAPDTAEGGRKSSRAKRPQPLVARSDAAG